MRLSQPATLLLVGLMLSGCGAEQAAQDTAPVATAPSRDAAVAAARPGKPEPPPMPTGDFRIASVTLGDAVDEEGQVVEAKEVFATGAKIHAAVVSLGSSDGLTVSAHWTSADGSTVATAGQSLRPESPTVTTFSISQPDSWPEGDYRVDVSINGRVMESRSFSIR